MSQKPTVGRIVHYFVSLDGTHLPAIITKVHADTLVNLRVFDDEGGDVSHHAHVNKGNKPGYWNWPERVGEIREAFGKLSR